jgi:hypothetical protein
MAEFQSFPNETPQSYLITPSEKTPQSYLLTSLEKTPQSYLLAPESASDFHSERLLKKF